MALSLPPELEQRVTALARATAREPEDVLADLVGEALDNDAAFRAAVREGIAQLDRGEQLTHDQVMKDLRTVLAPRGQ